MARMLAWLLREWFARVLLCSLRNTVATLNCRITRPVSADRPTATRALNLPTSAKRRNSYDGDENSSSGSNLGWDLCSDTGDKYSPARNRSLENHRRMGRTEACPPKFVFAGGFEGSANIADHRHDKAWEILYVREEIVIERTQENSFELKPGTFIPHPADAIHGDRHFLHQVLLISNRPLERPQFGHDL